MHNKSNILGEPLTLGQVEANNALPSGRAALMRVEAEHRLPYTVVPSLALSVVISGALEVHRRLAESGVIEKAKQAKQTVQSHPMVSQFLLAQAAVEPYRVTESSGKYYTVIHVDQTAGTIPPAAGDESIVIVNSQPRRPNSLWRTAAW